MTAQGPDIKTCTECGEEYPRGHPRGAKCYTCKNGIERYGLNRLEQEELLESQGGTCAVCPEEILLHQGRGGKSGVIDHIHGTKIPRGVLCNKHNNFLSSLEHQTDEDILDFLIKVINYLLGFNYKLVKIND